MNIRRCSIILAVTMLLSCLPVNAFALAQKSTIGQSGAQTAGIYIASDEVPQSATEYAKMIFRDMDIDDMAVIGFSSDEAKNAKLAHGFISEKYDLSSNNDIYKFPIMSGDTVKGILTVMDTPDGYGAQFGSDDDFASALNRISTTADNPVTVVSSLEAYYTVDSSNDVEILNKSIYFDEGESDEQMNDLKNKPVARSIAGKSVISISKDNTYTDTANLASSRSYTGKTLNAAFVKNFTVADSKGDAYWQCWACVLGSEIAYIKGSGNASTLAHEIANKQYRDTGDPTASVSEAANIISSRLNKTFSRLVGKMTTKQIETQILNYGVPFYTYWLQDAGRMSHAMLAKGYKKSSTGKESLTKLVLMDPNKSGGVTTLVNGYYVFQDEMYYWDENIFMSK